MPIHYKGFKSNLICHGYQYEIGKEHIFDGIPDVDSFPFNSHKGFHSCKYPQFVSDLYFELYDIFAEVWIPDVDETNNTVTNGWNYSSNK